MFSGGCTSIFDTEHNWKFKFSMQTYLTHKNTIRYVFEYCHSSLNF